MLYKIYGATCVGIDTIPVTIETDITPGIAYVVVGLPDNAVRESQHRIMSALHHFGYKIPGKRVVVNLAPADLKKAGTGFDLGISTGILTASGQIEPALDLSTKASQECTLTRFQWTGLFRFIYLNRLTKLTNKNALISYAL